VTDLRQSRTRIGRVRRSIDALAYDHVDEARLVRNLNPSVEDLAGHLRDGDIMLTTPVVPASCGRARLRNFERPDRLVDR